MKFILSVKILLSNYVETRKTYGKKNSFVQLCRNPEDLWKNSTYYKMYVQYIFLLQ